MKNLLLFFFIISGLQLFASTPPDPHSARPPHGLPSPIDSSIVLLLVIAIAVAFYFYKKQLKTT